MDRSALGDVELEPSGLPTDAGLLAVVAPGGEPDREHALAIAFRAPAADVVVRRVGGEEVDPPPPAWGRAGPTRSRHRTRARAVRPSA